MSHPLPPKKEVALALLERSSVHVHLDPRGASALVPPWFKRQPQLVLQIGLNMPVPIPDLRLDEEGMSCTLSFNRSPFHCVVPWASVFAMVGDDGRGMVWPDEVPPEIAKQPPQQREAESSASAPAGVAGQPAQGRKAASKRAPAVEAAREEKPTSEKADKGMKAKKGPKKKRPASPGAQATEAPEPELRPMLVAVPPSAPSSSGAHRHDGPERRAPARPAPEKKPAPVVRPQPAAADPHRRAPSKPKRELPPYLRVVK